MWKGFGIGAIRRATSKPEEDLIELAEETYQINVTRYKFEKYIYIAWPYKVTPEKKTFLLNEKTGEWILDVNMKKEDFKSMNQ